MRQDTDERAIVLFPDRAKLFRTVLPSLLSLSIAIPIIKVWKSGKRGHQIVSLLTALVSLLWESLYVPLWFRLLFPRPIVVVNDEGIAYNPSAAWFTNFALKIRWEEIAVIFPFELVKAHWLAIVPKDVETFAQQQKLIRFRRLPLLVTASQVDAPFVIPEPMILSFTINELLSQIQTKYQQEIEASGIKIGEERKIPFKTGNGPTQTRSEQ